MSNKKRALTGIRPTGDLHLGNYLGAIREGLKLQKEFECFYFIADFHALTTNRNPDLLRSSSYDIIAAWVALGLDTEKHVLYRQSDNPLVLELAWYLSCVTGMGFLQKAHSYKDALAKDREVNHGVFSYPILMAADILLYDTDIVPVGKDQKQHGEMARDMAGSFNANYGEGLLKLPDIWIQEEVMLIPGLDGQKMSKSYNNVIPLFSSQKELRKKILSLVTDSTPLEAPKALEGSSLEGLYKHFASKEELADLRSRLAAGGLGWGHAKEELFLKIDASLAEARDRYFTLRAKENELEEILQEGAKRVFPISHEVLSRCREALGYKPGMLQPRSCCHK